MSKIIVNGTFDVLHLGHIRLLEFAKSYPNSYVSVLIDSDRRVRELKGPSRPVNNEYERCTLLFALKCVDRVDVFDSDEELEELIRKFEPDIMIKGSDYRGLPIIGAKYCKQIQFYDRLEKYSTTNKIRNIIDRG